MKNIIIINGPNLNLLGDREEEIYGKETLEIIKNKCMEKSEEVELLCSFHQNNSEGDIIDHIQSVNENFDGLIINPAAFTHTSVALLDALRAVKKPKIEIHLSNIYKRESYRRKSITSEGVDGLICGFDSLSYILAIEALSKLIYK